jgi:hypothetical protein
MLALKIPIAALLWLVWWAIHQEPEPADEARDDGGSKHPRHPRPPLGGRPRRRGPHGAPLPVPPSRARITVLRGKVSGRHPRVPARPPVAP